MKLQDLLVILIPLVLAFGLSVPLVSRLKRKKELALKAPPGKPTLAPPKPPVGKPAAAPPVTKSAPVAPPFVEEDVDDSDVIGDEWQVETEPEAVEESAVEALPERPRFRDRLGRARNAFAAAIGVRGKSAIDQSTWDDLEESLLLSDLGVHRTDAMLTSLKERVQSKELATPDDVLDALKADLKARLSGSDRTLHQDHVEGSPNVWLFVGVNGVGKTTTIGKVGAQQVSEGRSVIMAAGDTFRAAAAEQLGTWASRGGSELVRGAEGGDPSSVIFDGIQRAAAKGADLVLADTAGRLHTKTNLMEELKKVRRVADREPGRVMEVLLVIDATTGQNGMIQAQQFTEATDLTGVVLTKLDGSAKGGIVFAIETELGIPVKLVGLGEGINDLIPFDPDEFVEALFA
jgi:fused signal recognition particle receptor